MVYRDLEDNSLFLPSGVKPRNPANLVNATQSKGNNNDSNNTQSKANPILFSFQRTNVNLAHRAGYGIVITATS